MDSSSQQGREQRGRRAAKVVLAAARSFRPSGAVRRDATVLRWAAVAVIFGVASMTSVCAGSGDVWTGTLASRAELPGEIAVNLVQPYIKFTAASAVADPTPVTGQNVMDGGYVGNVASAPSYTNSWFEGVAYLRITSALNLRVTWETGAPLREPTTGTTLTTAFEMRHKGVWDIAHYSAPYLYSTYKGLYAYSAPPSGYGVSAWRAANLTGLNEWLQSGDPYFATCTGEVWIRGRLTRRGLVDPPGLYTQTTSANVYKPLTVTIASQ